jgi:hypothetical protein
MWENRTHGEPAKQMTESGGVDFMPFGEAQLSVNDCF